jgi:glycosyltransferase involved in cell wall biosynthesis
MTTQSPKKVLVCQRGARHRYAIPRLFEESGMLSALYTDSSAYSPLGRIAGLLGRVGIGPDKLRALASRVPGGIPASKIYSTDQLLFSWSRSDLLERELSARFKHWGLQDSDVVYSMYGEEFEFVEWACGQGKKLIVDIFIHPSTDRIMAVEHERVFGTSDYDRTFADNLDRHSRRLFELADIILCPSEWVREGVLELAPEAEPNVRTVPYGSSLNVEKTINEQPEPGRILFAGRDPFRKGLHHLAAAAHMMKNSGQNITVWAAGVSEKEIGWMELQGIKCLGMLPTDAMKREFRAADVFVLPSLSEGQAGVVLEAMACGCPVIATRESGIDFMPGCGITVPPCNPDALAHSIGRVVSDRGLRQQLAHGALRQAKQFSMQAWKERLVDVVESL